MWSGYVQEYESYTIQVTWIVLSEERKATEGDDPLLSKFPPLHMLRDNGSEFLTAWIAMGEINHVTVMVWAGGKCHACLGGKNGKVLEEIWYLNYRATMAVKIWAGGNLLGKKGSIGHSRSGGGWTGNHGWTVLAALPWW